MINHISKYFTLNRRERNGMIAIITFLFIILTVKYFIIYKYHPITSSVNLIALEEIAANLAEKNAVSEKGYTAISTHKKDSLFYFNPNSINFEQAVMLGFTEKTAHTLVKYRNKGGKFYKPDDLQKLYGMNIVLFDKLKPFVLIDNKNSFSNEFKLTKNENHFIGNKKQNITLEINGADSLEWMKLKGIGEGRARSILKYKKMLGGFYAVDQVKEAYFITDSVYNSIKGNLTVNPALVQKIKVNTADFKTLVHHPYIKYEGTKCVFALKRNKKITADDLRNSSCFTREQLEKVLIYLDFSE